MNEALIDAIAAQLRRQGSARSDPGEPTIAWRTAARAAARQLGRPIETIEHGGLAHAALRDWPANDLERQIEQKAMRRAINAVCSYD